MNDPSPPPAASSVSWTVGVLAGSVVLLGWVGNGLFPWGVAIGLAGVIASALWRGRRPDPKAVAPLAPALLSVSVLAALTVPSLPAALAAGLVGLSFPLWLADDPSHPDAGLARAVPAFGTAAAAVGCAGLITLLRIPGVGDLGVAVGLLAVGIVLLAVVLALFPLTPLRQVEEEG